METEAPGTRRGGITPPERNYTPIPNEWLEHVFSIGTTDAFLRTSLYVFYKLMGWQRHQTCVTAGEVSDRTGISIAEAEECLSRCVREGILLPMEHSGGIAYVLDTPENRELLEYCRAADETEPSGGEAGDAGAPRADDTIPGTGPSSSPGGTNAEQAGGGDGRGPMNGAPAEIAADLDLPWSHPTRETIVRLLGRAPTKDECERLRECGASEESIIEAMSSLLSRTSSIYTSDLIVYEYERLQSAKRRREREERLRRERERRLERQRRCPRCKGLGFVFVGADRIRECECRKESE